MTIDEAINRIDNLRHNFYTRTEKVAWLSRLDQAVFNDIILTHEDPAIEEFEGYTDETDGSTTLLVEAPYDEIYLHYMQSMIDYYNGEYDEFNNSNAMFQSSYNTYRNYYNKHHMPKSTTNRYY